ncbi:MAG: DUF4476 domain-containing protein [Crocinitomicaceae bacterium]
MKHFILFFALLTAGLSFSQGQGGVTVYSNTGDKFYVILNGVRQNDKPETNVKVTGLTNPYYSCKIISANNNFELEKNIVVKYDTLITYRIIEKKGKFKLRFFTEASLGTTTAQKDQTVVAYHATETVTPPTETVQTTANTGTKGNTTVTTTTTGTTSTVQTTGNTRPTENTITEGINMNISINENGMNTNVNVNANGTENVDMNTNLNTSETMTTTTSSNGVYEETVTTTTTQSNNGNTTTYYEETTVTSTTTGGNVTTGNAFENTGSVEPIDSRCTMTDDAALALANQVENEAFAEDQSRVANTAAQNKCMTTDQIKMVAEKFSFEDNKLSFLKSAYDNCYDQSNYYKLLETLTYSGDKEALQKYMDSKR